MTNITLQKQHRTLWHFIPGLALSAVITGVALWGGSIPAVAGAGFSALTLAILLGMVLGNTIYPHIWKSTLEAQLGMSPIAAVSEIKTDIPSPAAPLT